MQSAADGATPLLAACFGAAAAAGDFYAPRCVMWGAPTLAIASGVPRGIGLLSASERRSLSPANQQTLWEASEVACGEAFDL